MANFSSVASYTAEFRKMANTIRREAAHTLTLDAATRAQKLAEQSARSDLGPDRAFSGWRETRLDTRIKKTRNGHVLMPASPLAAAGWTTAEQGRNQGGSTGFVGPGVNVKTGLTARTKSGNVRKVRARKAKRWNGYTRAKRTASEAVSQMDDLIVKAAEPGLKRIIRKHFDVT